MNSASLMHGTDYAGQSLAGWWLAEKLDGWRMVWTGFEVRTRQGERYEAPEWFLAGLPSTPLDGELVTIGKTTCNAVTAAVQSGNWHRLEFRPFDVPSAGLPFEQAQEIISTLALPSHVRPVEWRKVKSTEESARAAYGIQTGGGEGAMCRRSGSLYRAGRVSHLLKLKDFSELAPFVI